MATDPNYPTCQDAALAHGTPAEQEKAIAAMTTDPYCDAQNINYGETCAHKATYQMTGGVQAGLHFCSRHVNKRSRYAKRIR